VHGAHREMASETPSSELSRPGWAGRHWTVAKFVGAIEQGDPRARAAKSSVGTSNSRVVLTTGPVEPDVVPAHNPGILGVCRIARPIEGDSLFVTKFAPQSAARSRIGRKAGRMISKTSKVGYTNVLPDDLHVLERMGRTTLQFLSRILPPAQSSQRRLTNYELCPKWRQKSITSAFDVSASSNTSRLGSRHSAIVRRLSSRKRSAASMSVLMDERPLDAPFRGAASRYHWRACQKPLKQRLGNQVPSFGTP